MYASDSSPTTGQCDGSAISRQERAELYDTLQQALDEKEEALSKVGVRDREGEGGRVGYWMWV